MFSPSDFPDMASGGVTEVMAMPLSETFLDITTTFFLSNPSVKRLSKEDRNCVFNNKDHSTDDVGATYTYSDCIVDCKIYNIQKVCGCRPFFYPRRGSTEC